MRSDGSLLAEKIGCVRGGRRLFSGLSFSVSPGEALLLTGRNGAGKSSLLRQLAGLLPLSSGTLSWPEEGPAESCHYVGHLDALKPAMTVGETAAFTARLLGGAEAAERALSTFGLAHLAHLPVALLSQGQRKRLALCRLLVAPRRLWLLDEPATALDAASQAALLAAIETHLAGGGLAVIATHGDLALSSTVRSLELGTAKEGARAA